VSPASAASSFRTLRVLARDREEQRPAGPIKAGTAGLMEGPVIEQKARQLPRSLGRLIAGIYLLASVADHVNDTTVPSSRRLAAEAGDGGRRTVQRAVEVELG
jgi:hypothetical protein